MTARRATAATAAIALAGCAVGPDFHRPPPPALATYTRGDLPGTTATAEGRAQRFVPGARLAERWWRMFGSRALDATVERALANNASLEAARAALRQSQYSLRAGYGVFLPQINGSASGARQRFTPAQFGSTMPASIFNLFTLDGAVSYTLDVFGGQRRTVEQLRAQVDVQRNQLAGAQLMLAGNVVNTVIARAGYLAQIQVTEEFIAAVRDQLAITEAQWNAGTVPYANVLSIRTQLASTLATLPPLRLRLAQADHLLATLVGRAPSAWTPPEIPLTAIQLPRDLPVRLPSTLVRHRPDILVAEASLHVANAQVGIATAAMFPSFTIDASIGSTTTRLRQLFDHSSLVWSWGASLFAPIFRGGTLWYQRKAAIEGLRQARANYRQTVLTALADVANALRAVEYGALTLDAETEAVTAARDALHLIEVNYQAGTANYLQVLVANVQYHQAQLSYIDAVAQRLQNTVTLFVALGGGWQ